MPFPSISQHSEAPATDATVAYIMWTGPGLEPRCPDPDSARQPEVQTPEGAQLDSLTPGRRQLFFILMF